MKNQVKIELARLGGPTYIGRTNGAAARNRLNLDALEQDANNEFLVDIPVNTYNINSSYFLGLFGKSISHFKDIEAFKQKFKFDTHGKSYKAIERGIERALVKEKGLDIG